jgi:hypothetical protein
VPTITNTSTPTSTPTTTAVPAETYFDLTGPRSHTARHTMVRTGRRPRTAHTWLLRSPEHPSAFSTPAAPATAI